MSDYDVPTTELEINQEPLRMLDNLFKERSEPLYKNMLSPSGRERAEEFRKRLEENIKRLETMLVKNDVIAVVQQEDPEVRSDVSTHKKVNRYEMFDDDDNNNLYNFKFGEKEDVKQIRKRIANRMRFMIEEYDADVEDELD